ncbi:MAG: GAF domain-containing protein [Anaerolineae bacterium]
MTDPQTDQIPRARPAEALAEQELSAVIAVAQRLIEEALRPDLDLDRFLAHVMDQTLKLMAFDFGWLLLREGDCVRIRAADAAHLGDIGTTFPIEDCISGVAMLRREVIHVPELNALPDALRRIYKAPRSAIGAMRSELTVPLIIGAEAIGALSIESRQPHAFTWRHVEMLRLLSGHAALAIALARSRQEAAALSALALDLARETAMPQVVRSVLEHALRLIGAQFGQLLLIEGAELVVHYTTNQPPRDLGLRVKVHDSVSGLAVQERRPIIVADVTRPAYTVVEVIPTALGGQSRTVQRATERPRYQRVLERERARIRAELAIPLACNGEIVGVLNLETADQWGFSEAQRAEISAFCQETCDSFVAALTGYQPGQLERLLREALARAHTPFGQLLQLDGDELVIVATTGGEAIGTRVAVADSVSGQAVITRAPVYVPDVDAEPRYRRYLGEEMKSELAVPLLSGERIIGVLNVESPVPGFFTPDHARILQALAGQAAVAIERAQRFEVERLAAIGGLAGDIVHRLNNPLGALGGWLEMLQRKPFYPDLIRDYPYVEQFVARVRRDLDRAKVIIQELRSELRRQAPIPLVVQQAIAEALDRAGLAEGDEKIEVHIAAPQEAVRVLAGPQLAGVLWNLFDNARKAMPEGGSLTVTVRHAVEPGWVTVEVTDTGVGIEPWRLPFIFEAGASTTADSYAPAHGLGLWWTRHQVESFGGRIEAQSQPGAGTRFIVRLRAAD